MAFAVDRFFKDVVSTDPDLREMALSDLSRCPPETPNLLMGKWTAVAEKVLEVIGNDKETFNVRQTAVFAIPRVIALSKPFNQETLLLTLLHKAVSPNTDICDLARESLQLSCVALVDASGDVNYWQLELPVVRRLLQEFVNILPRESAEFAYNCTKTFIPLFGRVCRELVGSLVGFALQRSCHQFSSDAAQSSFVVSAWSVVTHKAREETFSGALNGLTTVDRVPQSITLLTALLSHEKLPSTYQKSVLTFLQKGWEGVTVSLRMSFVRLFRAFTTNGSFTAEVTSSLQKTLLTMYDSVSIDSVSTVETSSDSDDDYFYDSDTDDTEENYQLMSEILSALQPLTFSYYSGITTLLLHALSSRHSILFKRSCQVLALLIKSDVYRKDMENKIDSIFDVLCTALDNKDTRETALSNIDLLIEEQFLTMKQLDSGFVKKVTELVKVSDIGGKVAVFKVVGSLLTFFERNNAPSDLTTLPCNLVLSLVEEGKDKGRVWGKAAELFPAVLRAVNRQGSPAVAQTSLTLCDKVVLENSVDLQWRIAVVESLLSCVCSPGGTFSTQNPVAEGSVKYIFDCLCRPPFCQTIAKFFTTHNTETIASHVSKEVFSERLIGLDGTGEVKGCAARVISSLLRTKGPKDAQFVKEAEKCVAVDFDHPDCFSAFVELFCTILDVSAAPSEVLELFYGSVLEKMWSYISCITCNDNKNYSYRGFVEETVAFSSKVFQLSNPSQQNKLTEYVRQFLLTPNRDILVDCHAIVVLLNKADPDSTFRFLDTVELSEGGKILCTGEIGGYCALNEARVTFLFNSVENLTSEFIRKCGGVALSKTMSRPENCEILVQCAKRCASGPKICISHCLQAISEALNTFEASMGSSLPLKAVLDSLWKTTEGNVDLVGSCLQAICCLNPKIFLESVSVVMEDGDVNQRLILMASFRCLSSSGALDEKYKGAISRLYEQWTSKTPVEERHSLMQLLLSVITHCRVLLSDIGGHVGSVLANELKEDPSLISRLDNLGFKEDRGLPTRRLAYDCVNALLALKDSSLLHSLESTTGTSAIVRQVTEGCGSKETDVAVRKIARKTFGSYSRVFPESVNGEIISDFCKAVEQDISGDKETDLKLHALNLVFMLVDIDTLYQDETFYPLYLNVCAHPLLSKVINRTGL